MSNPDTPLVSRRNLIALGCGFLLAFGVWWLTGNDKEERAIPKTNSQVSSSTDLDRVIFAVSRTRSWHVREVGVENGQTFQTDQDVMCPFDSHTVTIAPGAAAGSATASEFIETEDKIYGRQGGDSWHAEPSTSPDKCRNGPRAGALTLLGILGDLKGATVTKGQVIQTEGHACRLWEFSAGRQVRLPANLMCVDDATALPFSLRLGGLQIQYTNWNQPVAIVPPEVTDR